MKSNLKKKGLLTVLGCLMFSIAMMFGAMIGGNSFVAFASETDEVVAPSFTGVTINEADQYSYKDSYNQINITQGKAVNIQLE